MSVRDSRHAHSAADTMAVAWRAGSVRLGVLAAHEPIKPDGFSDEDAWTLQLAAFAAGLVWQIKASEQRIRALGDAEAQRLHEHIERTRSMEKMRSDFLKLASHELRGPIAVVRGYFSMMADKSLDAEALERAMPVIERKLDDMNALVNEMLETARLEEGITRLERAAAEPASHRHRRDVGDSAAAHRAPPPRRSPAGQRRCSSTSTRGGSRRSSGISSTTRSSSLRTAARSAATRR